METALKQITKLLDHVGYRTRLIVLSVLFPGFILVCEGLASVWLNYHGSLSFQELKDLADFVGNKNIVLVLFLTVLLLAASFATGFIARTFSFQLSDLLIRRNLLPRRSFGQRLHHLEEVYGESRVGPVMNLYHVFNLVQTQARVQQGRYAPPVVRLPRPAEFYIREYCKLWLRAKVPSLCTDHTEIEINIFLSLLFPISLSAIPILLADHDYVHELIAATVVLCALLLLAKINESRCYETEQALVHFLFAHWERLHTRGKGAAQPGRPGQAKSKSAANGHDKSPAIQPPASANTNGTAARAASRSGSRAVKRSAAVVVPVV